MPAAVASPCFLLAAMILFSLVAYDVRGPGLRLLPQYVDGPAHAWVRDHLPSPVRAFVAEKVSGSTHPLPAQPMLQLSEKYAQDCVVEPELCVKPPGNAQQVLLCPAAGF